MKHVLVLLALITSLQLKAQTNVKYNPATKTYTSLEAEKKADSLTEYKFVDNDGNVYNIYKNSKGRPYIIRKSKKTGKQYRQYLEIILSNNNLL